MAYDSAFPADDGYLADFPAGQREQHRAIINDKIVNAGTLKGATSGNAKNNIPVSNGTVCTSLNADLLDGKHAAAFSLDGHTHAAATTSSNGMMSNTDKSKLDGIAAGAEVNQNAYANFKIDSTTIQADAKQDTLTLAAGSHIALTPDATNDKVTIAFTGTLAEGNGGTGKTALSSVTVGKASQLATARTIDGVSFNGSAAITHFGSCSTAAATAAKVVACTGFSLVTGAVIYVKFTVTNTAASPTLNVNSTGAKAIQYRGAAISAGYLAAKRTYGFVYDGSAYQLIGDLDTNTNTDTKVTNTLGTTTKFFLCGTTSDKTNTGTLVFDTGIYASTTAGQLVTGSLSTGNISSSGVITLKSGIQLY